MPNGQLKHVASVWNNPDARRRHVALEIAGRSGSSTGAQLSKAFDRRFGMTPLLFRELHCRPQAA